MPTQLSPKHKYNFAVLWDLDGTLIDTNQYHWQAWSEELQTLGQSITREEFSASFGQRNDTILRLWINPALSEQEIQQISDSKEARYRHLILEHGLTLLPGAAGWLENLHAGGHHQALATMTGRENINTILSVLPILQYLDEVVTGDDVANGKPNPEIFLLAAQKLNMAAEKCIVIEDAPAGIEAARRAGMKSIGVNPHKVLPADWYTESLDLLPEWIFQQLLEGPGE